MGTQDAYTKTDQLLITAFFCLETFTRHLLMAIIPLDTQPSGEHATGHVVLRSGRDIWSWKQHPWCRFCCNAWESG
jgi:hypothetical protein